MTGSKKVFTKIDLRWRFDNIRIKEENEWKGAVSSHSMATLTTPND